MFLSDELFDVVQWGVTESSCVLKSALVELEPHSSLPAHLLVQQQIVGGRIAVILLRLEDVTVRGKCPLIASVDISSTRPHFTFFKISIQLKAGQAFRQVMDFPPVLPLQH